MNGKVIKNITVKRESRPYTDCLYTVLTSAGMFHKPKYMLSGMTGMAFIFVTHKNLIPPSTEMYTLAGTSWNSVERLGIYSEIHEGLKFSPTFPLYQRKAVERIKESIDRGIAAIVWAAQITDFGVIYGYDDEDEVFFFKDRFRAEEQILLYKNLGRVEASFWMCQIIGDSIEKDIRDIYFDSLECSVDEWELTFALDKTRNEYAAGRNAYNYLINALQKDDFHEVGACKIINYNITAKNEINKYYKEVIKEFPQLSDAALKYEQLNNIYKQIGNIIPRRVVRNLKINRNSIPELINYIKNAKEMEEKAINEIKKFMNEILNNRYFDLYDVKKFI